MTTEKISIIIPVYNVEKYVAKCIESVIGQTYKNLEILLVDDGSIDTSNNICKKYAKKDKRIILIEKKNGGLSDARNKGMEAASGDYFFFVDSDDYISTDIIEYLHSILKANNADISTCLFVPFYENAEEPIATKGDNYVLDTEKALEALLYQNRCTTSAWGKLYKKELFKDIKYPIGKICEDLPVTYKLFSKSKKIVISDSKKYFYLQRANSIVNSKFSEKRAEAMDFAHAETQFIEKRYPKLKKAAINREFMESIYVMLSLRNDKEYAAARNKATNIIKKLRGTVLFDKKASRKSKLYAIISYLGVNKIYKIKDYLKRRR